MTIYQHKLLRRQSRVVGQWMNSFIIHDNICSLIHKKCHVRNYLHEINYHMTLNMTYWVWNILGIFYWILSITLNIVIDLNNVTNFFPNTPFGYLQWLYYIVYTYNVWIFEETNSDLVQPLAHGLFGLVANPIAKSYGWKRYLKNMS